MNLALKRKRLLTLLVSIGHYDIFLKKLLFYAKKNRSFYVCVANVHMLIEAYEDPNFASIVNNADFVTPDGMPLVKGLEWLYGLKQDRIAGMDLLPDLLSESQERGIKVFFYGGTQKMIDQTELYCKSNYPLLSVAGMISPPFRKLSLDEENDYIDQINQSEAGFVFVALGCPKQERWMASMKGRINACMIGIGGALPVMIGMQKRAPKWMQDVGLEWFFRLSQEPKRLFGRYFRTNSIFLYLFLREWIKIKVLRSNC